MSNRFSKLEKQQTVRSKMTVCPIIKQKVLVSPLTVGDDLHIRTMVAIPELYDSELSLMVFNHSKFTDLETQPTYDDFTRNISHTDRKMILWAIYVATYAKIKDAQISCPKCHEQFKQTIDVDKLMTDKTVSVWQEDKVFTEYSIKDEFRLDENTVINFYLKLPTIADHLSLLSGLSSDMMQQNFDRFETILSRTDELLLSVAKAEITDDDGTDTFETIDDLRVMFDRYIPIDAQESISDKYDKTFDKYNPKFTHFCDCPKCKHSFDFNIDIETILFKRFLNT